MNTTENVVKISILSKIRLKYGTLKFFFYNEIFEQIQIIFNKIAT